MSELGLRNAQQFGLAAGDFAIEFRIAEKRCPHALFTHLGGFTLREKLFPAHVTAAARDLKRDYHTVADAEIARFRPGLADDAHRFVAEDVTRFHESPENLVEMQVGPTDVRRGDFDNGVGGLFDLRVGYRLHAHVAFALPGDSFHRHSCLKGCSHG